MLWDIAYIAFVICVGVVIFLIGYVEGREKERWRIIYVLSDISTDKFTPATVYAVMIVKTRIYNKLMEG